MLLFLRLIIINVYYEVINLNYEYDSDSYYITNKNYKYGRLNQP